MISAERFSQLDKATSKTADMAVKELESFVQTLNLHDISGTREALITEMQFLTSKYGDVNATVAAEYFESAYKDYFGGNWNAILAPTTDPELVSSDVHYAVGSLVAGDVAAMQSNLNGSLARRVMQASDDTLKLNVEQSGKDARWAVVPHPGACQWCQMMGSRGFVYRTEETGKLARHNDCRCTTVMDFDTDNPALEDYYPYDLYQGAYKGFIAANGGHKQWNRVQDEAAKLRKKGDPHPYANAKKKLGLS